VDTGMYVVAGSIARGVHVGAQSERGFSFKSGACGNPGQNIEVFVKGDVGKADSLEFCDQEAGHVFLTVRRRQDSRVGFFHVALGTDRGISGEPLEQRL